jgi:hypothetical protein
MAVKSVQLGQHWRRDSNGEVFLVTKLYDEVFSQMAVLRSAAASAGSPGDTVRVKVARGPGGASLPGYSFTQDEDF